MGDVNEAGPRLANGLVVDVDSGASILNVMILAIAIGCASLVRLHRGLHLCNLRGREKA